MKKKKVDRRLMGEGRREERRVRGKFGEWRKESRLMGKVDGWRRKEERE